jgi:hypothetical protein
MNQQLQQQLEFQATLTPQLMDQQALLYSATLL